MTRLLAIFAALTCAASAQTYRTVTADTNNVIRTNFSLPAAQVTDIGGLSFAISNVTGLQSALDGKLATNGDAISLTNFPASLLRTNGDGSGLTNLPNADLGSATGILPLANGGTGATNASEARTALELGTAATNDATAFQPASTNLTALASGDGSSLTNVTITDASTLTNFPAELLRTNGDAAALTNFPSELLRTNGDGSGLSNVAVDLTAVLPSYSNNALKVLAVASGETNVEWIAVSNTVTDASALTNFPASILQTNGDASGLTNFPSELLRSNGSAAALTSFPADLLRTNGDASGLTNFPTLNQNTTGTASNVTGIVEITNGGTGTNSASGARVNLLPSYTGNSNKVLAVNAGETDVEWVVQSGGGLTSPVAVVDGGTGATNAQTALTNLSVIRYVSAFSGPMTVISPFVNGTLDDSVVLGGIATAGASTAIGYDARADAFATSLGNRAKGTNGGIAIGYTSTGNGGTAIGGFANASGYGVGIGDYANGFGEGSAAVGRFARTTTNYSVQLGTGTNGTIETIQFLSAGTVNTNEWAALANAGTIGTNVLRSTNAAGAQAAIFPATTTNAPTNTNAPTPDAWLDVTVGTNAYKLPLWQ